jgi:signal transduction histidine kinase
MPRLPLAFVSAPGLARERLLDAFPGVPPQTFDSLPDFEKGKGEEWGVVLLGPDVEAHEALAFLIRQTREEIPWSAVLVLERHGGYDLRPVSLGHPVSPEKIMEVVGDPQGKGPLHELHWVLRVVAKARHDLNNPLTSGLAETQLLLMDEHPPEVAESLGTIQEQYRRLRDMVADLSRLRVQKTIS